jgi:peroxiredoxin
MSPKTALGMPAPDFELKDFDGHVFRLSARRGEKALVLVFNRGFT